MLDGTDVTGRLAERADGRQSQFPGASLGSGCLAAVIGRASLTGAERAILSLERLRNCEKRSFSCPSERVFLTLFRGAAGARQERIPFFPVVLEGRFRSERSRQSRGWMMAGDGRPRGKKGGKNIRWRENLLLGRSYNVWRGKALAGLSGPARRAEGRKKPLPDSSLFFIILRVVGTWAGEAFCRPAWSREKKIFIFPIFALDDLCGSYTMLNSRRMGNAIKKPVRRFRQ